MPPAPLIFLALILSILGPAIPGGAQTGHPDRAPVRGSAPLAPTSGFRAEFLQDLAFCEQRYISLAEAMPAEKYSWRPAEGMRTLGGLFAHVVIDNYKAVEALDQGEAGQPGEQFNFRPETILALAEDKPKLLEALKNSFAILRGRILKLNDADGDKPQKMLNRETTLRGALLIADRHLGEHMGQAVTYARINGVVPPWKQGWGPEQRPAERPKP